VAERVHGGIDERALRARGIDPGSVCDFSVNLNPYGPCDAVLAAVRAAPLDRYPDPHAREAREAWAAALDRTPAEVAVGHGAADLFWAITRAFVCAGGRVVIAEPTFSELRVAAAAVGAQVERVFARSEQGFRLDLPQLARAARGARALYVCSPNNPTGEHIAITRLAELAAALAPTLVVLDQSFIALSDHEADARMALPPNVVCVRSLTKEFACPGLRIGLCLAEAATIERIEAVRPTWHTSSPALAALVACARESAFVAASWQRMRADREAVRQLLASRGYAPLPSATSYQLVPLSEPASAWRARLLGAGVLVRDCASFGLPRHARIAALPAHAREQLARALDATKHA
jgi:histidinol-phosphate aminotransferase